VTVPYEHLVYDKPAPGVARITLNRPEVLNALHVPLLEEIYAAAAEADDDSEVAVIVYAGAGTSFCAGRDFKYSGMLQTEDPQGWFAWRRAYKGLGDQTWHHPKPTVAAVQGYALGTGAHLATLCDITIAAEDAKFGYPEFRYGELFGDHVWNVLAGAKKTKEWLFTGRNVDAQEAYDWGLVNRVVPLAELESNALTLARDIAVMEEKNPGYQRANKIEINLRHPAMTDRMVETRRAAVDFQFAAEYGAAAVESQERFYTKVAEKGIKAAVDEMHEGFSTRR
jgi:enoyl-CoA hydratase